MPTRYMDKKDIRFYVREIYKMMIGNTKEYFNYAPEGQQIRCETGQINKYIIIITSICKRNYLTFGTMCINFNSR